MSEIEENITYYLSDKFQLEDISQRKLYINMEIDENIIDDIVYFILKWNRDDKGIDTASRQPIILYINSPGGTVSDGFALIDTIICSKTPVYTVNLGTEYSMAFLIGLAGHRRYTNSFATFLLHDGSTFLYNSMSKVKDTALFYTALEEKIKNFVLSHSKMTAKEYDKKYGSEYYLFPEEAKEKGFVDYIVGIDCDIDEII